MRPFCSLLGRTGNLSDSGVIIDVGKRKLVQWTI
jgi:hypothetical protein